VLKSASGTHDQQKTRQSTVVSGAPGNTGDQVHLQLEIDPLAIRARCSCHNYNSKCSGLMTTTVAVAPAQWVEIQDYTCKMHIFLIYHRKYTNSSSVHTDKDGLI